MRDFVKNQSAFVHNQGWTMKQVKALSLSQLKLEFKYIQRTLERSNLHNFKRTTFRPAPSLEAPSAKRARQEVPQDVHAATSQVPASVSPGLSVPAAVSIPAASLVAANILVPAISPAHAVVSIPAEIVVHTDESHLDAPPTTSKHVSTKPTVDASTPSSSPTCRKHLAKKRVTPIVDIADVALIKFDSASDSDDDPLPYAPYVGWEMVPFPLGSIHAYYDMEGHTKHFTSLCELLHMVEKNDGDLHVLFQSLDDEDAHDFWRNQDSWRIRNWRLYPRTQVHVLKTVDGRVIHMFVDVSYPLSAATLQRMLKHGLEVPKLLVGGDLTMAEQLVTQNWMVFTFYVPFWNEKWLVQGGTTLELASPEQTATGFFISAVWMFAAVLLGSCYWNKGAILELPSEDLSRILKLTLSNSRLGEDCWELQN
nr:aminoacyl-tRNA synthetase, class 1a, anticodon-binding [Tanacetum cinerariifolium]